MNQNWLKQQLTNLSKSKIWLFLVIGVVSGLICVAALRANNETMIKLRNDVFQADASGGDVQAALNKLEGWVTAHMNTQLTTGTSVYPPIQLQYTYERLLATEQAQLDQQTAALAPAAQAYCQAHPSTFAQNGVTCIQQYDIDHGVKQMPIPDSLYKFDFISPSWSPDLAGWMLLTSGLSFLAALILLVKYRFAKR
jgi:hypothetical protein